MFRFWYLSRPLAAFTIAIAIAIAIAIVVKVPKPWYAPKSLVASRMRGTIPQYEALPGVAFKAFTLAQTDSRYGGIYLWKDWAARGVSSRRSGSNASKKSVA